MIAPNSIVRQKEGAQGEEEAGGRRKEGSRGTPDTRRGRSHRSNSVRRVGCEEHEKTWTVVVTPQEGQRKLGITPILS